MSINQGIAWLRRQHLDHQVELLSRLPMTASQPGDQSPQSKTTAPQKKKWVAPEIEVLPASETELGGNPAGIEGGTAFGS